MRNEEKENRKKEKKPGVPFLAVIFFLMLVYLLFRSLDALRGDTLSAYNVGSPSSDGIERSFTGLILRNETIVTAEESGTVQYYRTGGEKLANHSLVCVIDRQGTLRESLRAVSDLGGILSESSILAVSEELEKLGDSYDPRDFSTGTKGEASLRGLIYTRLLTDGGSGLASSADVVNVRTEMAGFLLLSKDGYEKTVPEELCLADFSEERESVDYRSGDVVSAGNFLYKLVGDNGFRLVFPLESGEAARLKDRKSLSVSIEGGSSITGDFSVITLKDGTTAGVLTFQKYGVNWLDRRLVSFTLSDSTVEGFKIPESAIVRKSFFAVPSEFVTSSAGSSDKVVLKETGGGAEAVTVTAYTKGSDDSSELIIGDGVTYICSEELKAGTVLLLEEEDPDTGRIVTRRETLGVTASLEGVYQINKGYCVFRPVLRLENSVESSYVMVSADISYSIRSCDRIVLDASGVRENEIIFE